MNAKDRRYWFWTLVAAYVLGLLIGGRLVWFVMTHHWWPMP